MSTLAVEKLYHSYIENIPAAEQLQLIALISRHFQQQYGMDFQQFGDYLHERSALLVSGTLSPEQRKTLGQAVMQEEDVWFDWKMAREMLKTWLGLT